MASPLHAFRSPGLGAISGGTLGVAEGSKMASKSCCRGYLRPIADNWQTLNAAQAQGGDCLMVRRLFGLPLSPRQRFVVFLAVRIIRARPDSLVYICRDIGLDMSLTTYVLQSMYRMPHGNAKMLAFQSPAWGREKVEATIELHERLWEWAEHEGRKHS
jgi:hypothetical protein